MGAFILSIILAGLKVYQAYLVKPIFDKGLSSQSTIEEIIFLAGTLLTVVLLNFPSRFFHSLYRLRSGHVAPAGFRARFPAFGRGRGNSRSSRA